MNYKLDHRDEEQKREDYMDAVAEFDSIFEDRVDTVEKVYSMLTSNWGGVRSPFVMKLVAQVVEECETLSNKMDELWNRDIPGSCHSEPDSDLYEWLNGIILLENGEEE